MKVTFVTGWGKDWKDTKPEDPWRQWLWSRGEWPGQVRWQKIWRDGEALETGYSTQFHGTWWGARWGWGEGWGRKQGLIKKLWLTEDSWKLPCTPPLDFWFLGLFKLSTLYQHRIICSGLVEANPMVNLSIKISWIEKIKNKNKIKYPE